MRSTIIQKPRITVIGGAATNMVMRVERHPGIGEMALGDQFFTTPGGKGANQAVAAARLGAAVTLLAKTGNDLFGRQSIQQLQEEGIQTSNILSDQRLPSGVAFVTVDGSGRSSMTVVPGANNAFTPQELAAPLIVQAGYLLLQLDIPEATILHAAQIATAHNIPVLLDPAPANTCSDELLQHVSILIPNRTAAASLSGITIDSVDDAMKAARIIAQKGMKAIVITMGREGVVIMENEEVYHIPASIAEAVDTTAAGDVFNGALAVALAEGKSLRDAAGFAAKAAAIAVTKWGAQVAAPYRRELKASV